jgi:hypothetical protein
MQKINWVIGLAGILSLATGASATTCAANTWCFGSNPTTVSDGQAYTMTGGAGTITVYSEQVINSGNPSINGDFNTFGGPTSTINGLFSTNDSVFDEGVGIAPYDPKETDSDFSNQNGISDTVGTSNTQNSTADSNVLLLELGNNIANGTTLSFLLQAGDGDGNVQTYSADFYTSDTTANVASSGLSLNGLTLAGTAAAGTISTNGTTAQVSFKKNTSGVEWVAIEADCHYMLLDTILATPPSSSVPEPRFYGLLLASLLGIAGVVYQRRRAAQANA